MLIPKNTLERKEKVDEMKDRGSRKQREENRNKVKEKEGETGVGKDVTKGEKLIQGCCYQSEICQSVPSPSTQLPR